MDKKSFAFDKTNFILLAIGMIVIIIGFLLMSGPGSTETAFEPDIFQCTPHQSGSRCLLFGIHFHDLWYPEKTER